MGEEKCNFRDTHAGEMKTKRKVEADCSLFRGGDQTSGLVMRESMPARKNQKSQKGDLITVL